MYIILITVIVNIYLINNFAMNFHCQISNEEREIVGETSILSNDIAYLKKSKTFCRTVITNISYPSLIQTVDEFIGEIVTVAQELRDMQVKYFLSIFLTLCLPFLTFYFIYSKTVAFRRGAAEGDQVPSLA